MKKYVNILDVRGRPVRDPKTRRPISELVEMTPEEVAAFEEDRKLPPKESKE